MALVPAVALAGTSAYDDALKDFQETLEAHMKNCERLARYEEADVARQRLMEVREHELFRRKEAIRSRQLAELLGVEESYVLEFSAFQQHWCIKLTAFEDKAGLSLAALKTRHEADLREFQQRLLIKSAFPRHGKEYFNMRKIEEYLAKLKDFPAAAAMREKADALGLAEEERWNRGRQEDLLSKEAAMQARLEAEAEGVARRLEQQRADLARLRQRELEGLMMRYSNAKMEMVRKHKQEKQAFEREMSQELKLIRGGSSKLAYK